MSESNSYRKWQINAHHKHKAPHSKPGMRGFMRFSGWFWVRMYKFCADDGVLSSKQLSLLSV